MREPISDITLVRTLEAKPHCCQDPAGFLGAGKSTLVRHILTAQHGRRIAVIVNEFGEELGIERAIVNENDVSHTAHGMVRVLLAWCWPAVVYGDGCIACHMSPSVMPLGSSENTS